MANKDKLTLPYSLAPNTLPDGTGYHRVLSHVAGRDGSAIFKGVAEKIHGQTAAGAELVWDALIETIRENLVKYQYKSSVNGVTFALEIPGSTDSVNGTPDEGAVVAISLPSSMKQAASNITPVYVTDETDAPMLKSAEDEASRNRAEITGAGRFLVTGNNLSVSGDDESIVVTAADGTEATAVVDEEDALGSFVVAHLSAALPPGRGKVVLATHGKRTPEGELRRLAKTVTIVAGDTPTPPTPEPIAESEDGSIKVMSVSGAAGDTGLVYGHSWTMEGEGLLDAEGVEESEQDTYLAGWSLRGSIAGEAESGAILGGTSEDGETLVLDSTFDVLDAPTAGIYENCELVAWLSKKSDHEYSEQLVVPVGTVVVAA